MRLLVLGGSRFVGHAVVSAALGQGWDVTIFNRGLSGPDVPGVTVVRGDRTRDADSPAWPMLGRGMPPSTPRATCRAKPRRLLSAWSRSPAVRVHVDRERVPGLAGQAAVGGLRRALLPA